MDKRCCFYWQLLPLSYLDYIICRIIRRLAKRCSDKVKVMEYFDKEDFIVLACLAQIFLVVFQVMYLKGITI